MVNVSSVAALYPHPSLMAYGMSKVALERLTVDAASQLAADGIAVNCFRIDLAVASEGFVANTPGADHWEWEPPRWRPRASLDGRASPPLFGSAGVDVRPAPARGHHGDAGRPPGDHGAAGRAYRRPGGVTGSAFAEPYPDEPTGCRP